MRRNISGLVAVVVLAVVATGCPSTTTPPSSSVVEELRLLTPEQERKLLENADRVEKKEVVRQALTNDNGEVVGTVTSQTTVIFLKPSAGGGRFSVNASCTGTCSGIPIDLCPGLPENKCGCNIILDKCQCAGCSSEGGCSGTCTGTKVGFGNFGLFIAMDGGGGESARVAQR